MPKNPYNPENQYAWTKKEDAFARTVYTNAIKNRQTLSTATRQIHKAFGETRTEGAIYARWKGHLAPKQSKPADVRTEVEDKDINPHDDSYITHMIHQYQEEGKSLKDAYQAIGETLNRDPLAIKHLWENKLQHQQTKTVTQNDVIRTLNGYVGSILEKEKRHLREENKRLQKELDEAKSLLQKFTKAFSGIVSLEEVQDIIDTQVDTPELIISSNGIVERKHQQVND